MKTIDVLLEYIKRRDGKGLTTDVPLSTSELNIVVIKVLEWLRLEHERSTWQAEGKKTCPKPLKVDMQYPWCVNLNSLVKEEKLFRDCFSIKGGQFDFADAVSEEDRAEAREKVFRNYIPFKTVYVRK